MTLRCLFSSNSPWSATGYAQQTKFITKGIQALGYPIAVHAWWGLQGGPVTIDGILHYPQHLDSYGNDAAAYYCRKFKADLLITLIDLWVMDPQLGNMGSTRWVPYFPIDSDPIPAAIGERFKTAHRLLVYSRYAEKLVKAYDGGKYAERVRYIPHGVDCETLRPCTTEEKAAFRRKLYGDWPDDAYIVGMVAANKGWPSRKSFPEAMEAFATFAANHPEARLYLHSYRASDFRGPELGEMAAHFGIADKVRFANPKMIIGGDYSDEQMREIFCSCDVLMAPSQGEGFGLPIIESQACFAGETNVTVHDPQRVYIHSYTGPLYRIKTKHTTLRVTPEHPFWTDHGWQLAKNLTGGTRLWYNRGNHTGGCHAKERQLHIYSGRIADLARTLSAHAPQRGGQTNGEDLCLRVLAGSQPRLSENLGLYSAPEVELFKRSRIRVHSRFDRWRRNRNHTQDEFEIEASGFDCEQFGTVNGMAGWKDRRSVLALDGKIESSWALPIPNVRIDLPPPMELLASLSSNQTTAHETSHRMDGVTAESRQSKELYAPPDRDHQDHSRSEYQAIDEITVEWVRDFPVYNFGTASGTYWAEGYLVHNCGVPVIVTDFSAMSELVGDGYRVKPLRLQPTLLWAKMAEADPVGVHHALEECYRRPKSAHFSQIAREMALNYAWPKVLSEYWAPWLAEMDGGRRELALELVKTG